MDSSRKKDMLDGLYLQFNRRNYVHPDPLEFLYKYKNPKDREIVGLIASSLAYGRVAQILKSVDTVLARMVWPRSFVETHELRDFKRVFADFKHRFTTDDDLAHLLCGVKGVIGEHGSLGAFFGSLIGRGDETVVPALTGFVSGIEEKAGRELGHIFPSPAKGSACKRLNLYLRWMVRKDEVDPGGWNGVHASQLVVPLDTHMHRIGRQLKFTKRKQADMRTAMEITDAFRRCSPEDPVRYDFALTRFGIHPEVKRTQLCV